MQVPYDEGVAIRIGPESCAGSRKVGREVLTGAHTGSVLSREIRLSRAPTLLSEAEGNIRQRRHRKSLSGPARSQTRHMCGTFSRENREIP